MGSIRANGGVGGANSGVGGAKGGIGGANSGVGGAKGGVGGANSGIGGANGEYCRWGGGLWDWQRRVCFLCVQSNLLKGVRV